MRCIASVLAAVMGITIAARVQGRSNSNVGESPRDQFAGFDLARNDGRQGMRETSIKSQSATTIDTSVMINRAVQDVFGFYRDFRNLPRFLGDVIAVAQIEPATSQWTIQGPLGIRVNWTIRLTEERRDELIRYETVTAPALKTYWTIHFAPGSAAGETEVREVMQAPLGLLGRAALALVGKHPAGEVASNLHRLKELMEIGRVSDTSYAVAGKFATHPNQGDRWK
jgi:uncharacterized membrane protein